MSFSKPIPTWVFQKTVENMKKQGLIRPKAAEGAKNLGTGAAIGGSGWSGVHELSPGEWQRMKDLAWRDASVRGQNLTRHELELISHEFEKNAGLYVAGKFDQQGVKKIEPMLQKSISPKPQIGNPKQMRPGLIGGLRKIDK